MRVVVVMILSALILVACSDEVPTPFERADAVCETVACELATLDAGRPLAPDDPVLQDYQAQLRYMARWCRESERQIADYAIAAHQTMSSGRESLYQILTLIPNRPGIQPKKRDCAERFATYAANRTGGQ